MSHPLVARCPTTSLPASLFAADPRESPAAEPHNAPHPATARRFYYPKSFPQTCDSAPSNIFPSASTVPSAENSKSSWTHPCTKPAPPYNYSSPSVAEKTCPTIETTRTKQNTAAARLCTLQ